MTPKEKVEIFTLDTILSNATVDRIKAIGFSRIPISFTADKKIICGILLAKSLVGY
jgi:CBS domain containing-hemolysin-like protein